MAHPPDNNNLNCRCLLAGIALFLSFLVSLSLPAFASLDIARVTFNTSAETGTHGIEQIRLGAWSFCLDSTTRSTDPCEAFSPCDLKNKSKDLRQCSGEKFAYDVQVKVPDNDQDVVHIGSSWTASLVLHAVETCLMFIYFLLLCAHRPDYWLSRITFYVAIAVSLIDVAFYFHVEHIMKKMKSIGAAPDTGTGLWTHFMMLILFFIEWGTITKANSTSGISISLTRKIANNHRWATNSALIAPASSSFTRDQAPNQRAAEKFGAAGYECPLCWENRVDLSALPCTHVFCTDCINERLRALKRCPICNTFSIADDLRVVYAV